MIYAIAMAAVMIALMVIQHIERKDLYDRIMSRDLNEYRDELPKPPKTAVAKAKERWKNAGNINKKEK